MNDKYILELKKLILETLTNRPDIKVYLFGSRAKSLSRNTSDVDIALDSQQSISNQLIVMLSEKIEESHIPYHVDIVNLTTLNETLKTKFLKGAIQWKDSQKD